MGAKVHVATRSRKRDIIVTALFCAAIFGTVLYIQAALYDKCKDFTNMTTVEDLQSYIQRFMHKSDSTNAAADNLVSLHKELTEVVDNSTRLASKQQEADDLQVCGRPCGTFVVCLHAGCGVVAYCILSSNR